MPKAIQCRACGEPLQHGFLCAACLRLHTATQSRQLTEFVLDHQSEMETLAIVLHNACSQLAVLQADALRHVQILHSFRRSDEQLEVFAQRLFTLGVAMGNVLAKVPIEVLVALQTGSMNQEPRTKNQEPIPQTTQKGAPRP